MTINARTHAHAEPWAWHPAVHGGGGLTIGPMIGSTDVRGEHTVECRVGVQNFLAMLDTDLGIDAMREQLQHFTGRPIPILQDGKAIAGLFSQNAKTG